METKFKVDENLPVDIVESLKQAGFDAVSIYDEDLVGEKDARVASVCKEEKRALVTLDIDFADIGAYPPQEYYGFIVLRLKFQDKRHILKVFSRLLKMIPDEVLERKLWIVDEERVRVRE